MDTSVESHEVHRYLSPIESNASQRSRWIRRKVSMASWKDRSRFECSGGRGGLGEGTMTKRLPFPPQGRCTTTSLSLERSNQPPASHKRKGCTNITRLSMIPRVGSSTWRQRARPQGGSYATAVCEREMVAAVLGRCLANSLTCRS